MRFLLIEANKVNFYFPRSFSFLFFGFVFFVGSGGEFKAAYHTFANDSKIVERERAIETTAE